MHIHNRLHELRLGLPECAPTHEFLPVNVLGDLAYVSGHAPFCDGAFRYRGKIGREFDLATGCKAAELAVLGCLASLEEAIGTLESVRRVVKMNGYVNCEPEFRDVPKVTDAASKLLIALFGDAGRHARTTVGVASLPGGVAVELELVVQIRTGSGTLGESGLPIICSTARKEEASVSNLCSSLSHKVNSGLNQKRRLPFVQMDVFTSVPLEGNQLAVFTDARGLTDAEMQALAREMNFCETTFIVPRDLAVQRERGVQVRIFTVAEELPFAGHPTLGTAMVLRGDSGTEEICLDLKVGKIPVRFSIRDGRPFGVMTQRDPEFGQTHVAEAVARAAGLTLGDIADDMPIQTVSTGVGLAMVPVKSLAVLQKLAPNWLLMNEYLKKTDAKFFYFVSREALNPEAKLQARMISYNGEDPATGGAAGPCAAWAVKYGVIPPEQQTLLEQGVEMKRRSQIFISADREVSKIVNVRVGGHAVEVARGEIFL